MSMILGLAVLASLQADRIDLRLAAMAMPDLMPKLASVTGRKLEFGSDLRDEIVLVSVEDVSADELLDRVAAATSATWSKLKDGKLLLTRPKGIEEAQRKAGWRSGLRA